MRRALLCDPGWFASGRGRNDPAGPRTVHDGVDQDDMIAALALKNLGGIYSHAPTAIRSDRFAPQGVRLRYVQCPQAPFLDSN